MSGKFQTHGNPRLDSLCYFLAANTKANWNKQELATVIVLVAGLSGFNTHRWENDLPWTVTMTKEEIPPPKLLVHRTVIQGEDLQVYSQK